MLEIKTMVRMIKISLKALGDKKSEKIKEKDKAKRWKLGEKG